MENFNNYAAACIQLSNALKNFMRKKRDLQNKSLFYHRKGQEISDLYSKPFSSSPLQVSQRSILN
jgi:hypothetical protein